jgi:predicted RNase H-like HicB family nuclease
MALRHYRALLSPAEDGSWGAVFPELPGCTSHGDDADHAARMAGEALALHLASMAEDGEEAPDPLPLQAPLPDWLDGDEPRPFRVLVPVELPGKAVRVTVSLEESLVARIDGEARRRGTSRSALLAEGTRRLLVGT